MINKLHEKLDSSIRKSLSKRGVNVLQNIYTGFDTEYYAKTEKFNELLSVQLAVNIRTYLKIPQLKSFELSTVDVLKNKTCLKRIQGLNHELFNSCIEQSIRFIRSQKFFDHDLALSAPPPPLTPME